MQFCYLDDKVIHIQIHLLENIHMHKLFQDQFDIELRKCLFNLGSYHTMAFQDGKIIGGGDWFDLTGFVQESTKQAMTE